MGTWQERFHQEYLELVDRIDKLEAMLFSWSNDNINFKPSCPYWLLEKQLAAMREYRDILEARNYIEHIW